VSLLSAVRSGFSRRWRSWKLLNTKGSTSNLGAVRESVFPPAPGWPPWSAMGNATYETRSAGGYGDEIIVSAEAVEAVAKADALVFGSLASRSPYNLEQFGSSSCTEGPR